MSDLISPEAKSSRSQRCKFHEAPPVSASEIYEHLWQGAFLHPQRHEDIAKESGRCFLKRVGPEPRILRRGPVERKKHRPRFPSATNKNALNLSGRFLDSLVRFGFHKKSGLDCQVIIPTLAFGKVGINSAKSVYFSLVPRPLSEYLLGARD